MKFPKSRLKQQHISISPSTPFMCNLSQHIDFFIKRKIKEDHTWSNLKVIFSGGDIPGEGEHKILDYIREWKRSDEFDINATHCLYGNDSDLILLSLITHLPYVMLLKESLPPFKKTQINQSNNREMDWVAMEVVYLNILREYLELEFKQFLGDMFDIERVIDDFVLLVSLVGNDFIN